MGFLKNLFMNWKPPNVVWKWAWVWQSSWCHLKNFCAISKIHYFDFLVSCVSIFNPVTLSLKWVTILVATTNRNMECGQSCKITCMMRVKGSERRPFMLIFRLNIVLHHWFSSRWNCHGNRGMETESSRWLCQKL